MAADASQLLKELKTQLRKDSWKENIAQTEAHFKQLQTQIAKARAEALTHFLSTGGTEAHFSYKDPLAQELTLLHKNFLKEKKAHLQQQQQAMRKRQQDKAAILQALRKELAPHLITHSAAQRIAALKAAWEALPAPPEELYKKQQSAYTALLHRAQKRQRMAYELKDLNKEKNTEQKIQLCQRLEALQAVPASRITQLQAKTLGRKYAKTGPALPEQEETLHTRFFTAYEALKKAHQVLQAAEKKETAQLLKQRKDLLERLENHLSTLRPQTYAQWQSQAETLRKLQSEWEALPSLPFSDVEQQACVQQFWKHIKAFYKEKKKFLAASAQEQAQQLDLRKELIAKAKTLLQAEKLDVDAFFTLQKGWKNAAPIPHKPHQAIHKEWKNLQNRFFKKKTKLAAILQQEAQEQYAQYEPLDQALNALAKNKNLSLEALSAALDTCPAAQLPTYLQKRWTKRFSQQMARLLPLFLQQKAPPVEALSDILKAFKKRNQLSSAPALLTKRKQLQQRCFNLIKENELLKINVQRLQSHQKSNPLQQQISQNIAKQEHQIIAWKQLISLYDALL